MAYNKGENDRYDKGNEKKSNFAPIIAGALFVVALIAVVVYRQPILNQTSVWLSSLKASLEESNKDESSAQSELPGKEDVVDNNTSDPEQEEIEDMQEEVSASTEEISETKAEKPNTPISIKESPITSPEKQPKEETAKTNKFQLEKFTGGNGKIGFKNAATGTVIIEAQYDNCMYFDKKAQMTYIAVSKNGLYGVIDMSNRIIIPFAYESIDIIYGVPGYWMLSRRKGAIFQRGILRTSNMKFTVPVEYEQLDIIKPKTMIIAKKNGLYGAINIQNQTMVPLQYKSVSNSVSRGNTVKANISFYDATSKKFCFDENAQAVDCY